MCSFAAFAAPKWLKVLHRCSRLCDLVFHGFVLLAGVECKCPAKPAHIQIKQVGPDKAAAAAKLSAGFLALAELHTRATLLPSSEVQSAFLGPTMLNPRRTVVSVLHFGYDSRDLRCDACNWAILPRR